MLLVFRLSTEILLLIVLEAGISKSRVAVWPHRGGVLFSFVTGIFSLCPHVVQRTEVLMLLDAHHRGATFSNNNNSSNNNNK